jgi:hypothetical protein
MTMDPVVYALILHLARLKGLSPEELLAEVFKVKGEK